MSYTPSQQILDRYADVLVNFALGGGRGVKKGEVVYIVAEENHKPLLFALNRAITKAGAHRIINYKPAEIGDQRLTRDFLDLASDEQLSFYADKYFSGIADQIDHYIGVFGDADPHVLKDADPKKLMQLRKTGKPFHDLLDQKEHAGKFTWTVGLYGTPEMAKEAGLSLEEYWEQIIRACYLEDTDPVATWRTVDAQVSEYRDRLNALSIEKLHVVGEDADLHIKLGEKRQWKGGGGANIPSFEVFTSPDWRGTEGWIRFNQPLYALGNRIEGIELRFKKGVVVEATATSNEKFLKEMIATEGADKIGEFSLTDSRLSKITKFMANTLFDENIGGKYGNTHIALGVAYKDCYDGNPNDVSKEEWERLGYNDSSVHEDLISTIDRTVTATLKDGRELVIYKDGQFQI